MVVNEHELARLIAPQAELAILIESTNPKWEDAALVGVASGESDSKVDGEALECLLDEGGPFGLAWSGTSIEDSPADSLFVCKHSIDG